MDVQGEKGMIRTISSDAAITSGSLQPVLALAQERLSQKYENQSGFAGRQVKTSGIDLSVRVINELDVP